MTRDNEKGKDKACDNAKGKGSLYDNNKGKDPSRNNNKGKGLRLGIEQSKAKGNVKKGSTSSQNIV